LPERIRNGLNNHLVRRLSDDFQPSTCYFPTFQPFNMQPTFSPLDNFGHSLKAQSFVVRAHNTDDIHETFRRAKKDGLTVTARGAGRSYNDASLNGGGLVLDLSGMNQILEWNPASGVVRCEPGVTLRQLWERVLPDGWWPPVVSGTMTTTLGGCLSTNIHGKNNFRAGPIGEHVSEFRAILPTGAEVTCTPKKNADLFYAFISGLGMLGIFTSITLKMKRVHSGLVEVQAWPTRTLQAQLDSLSAHAPKNDYIVGWLDTLTIGHGQIHTANHLSAGADPAAQKTLQVEHQNLPDRFFGVVPKSILYRFMAPFVNNLGWWAVNNAKYFAALRRQTFRQGHAAINFFWTTFRTGSAPPARMDSSNTNHFCPKKPRIKPGPRCWPAPNDLVCPLTSA